MEEEFEMQIDKPAKRIRFFVVFRQCEEQITKSAEECNTFLALYMRIKDSNNAAPEYDFRHMKNYGKIIQELNNFI